MGIFKKNIKRLFFLKIWVKSQKISSSQFLSKSYIIKKILGEEQTTKKSSYFLGKFMAIKKICGKNS